MAPPVPPQPRVAGPGDGAVAQLGERRNRTAEVRGSNPLGSTKSLPVAADSTAAARLIQD